MNGFESCSLELGNTANTPPSSPVSSPTLGRNVRENLPKNAQATPGTLQGKLLTDFLNSGDHLNIGKNGKDNDHLKSPTMDSITQPKRSSNPCLLSQTSGSFPIPKSPSTFELYAQKKSKAPSRPSPMAIKNPTISSPNFRTIVCINNSNTMVSSFRIQFFLQGTFK